MEDLTLESSIDGMLHMFDKDAAPGLKAIIQYVIGDESQGTWYFDINDGNIALHKGRHVQPSLEITTDKDTWLSIVKGETSGEKCLLEGKLKANGDMEILLQHDQIFSREKLEDFEG